ASPARNSKAGKKESTGRRLSQLCPPYATPSSNASLDHRRSDARIVENGFATSGGVSKSAKVVLVRPLDHVATKLGEGDEGDRPAGVDVGALDRNLAARGDVLDDLEDVLRTRRPDRDDHDAAGLELLEERRRNVVDAAGDDDLVEWGRFLPAVVA